MTRAAFLVDQAFLCHRTPDGHPERAERLETLLRFASRGDAPGIEVLAATRRATREELARVHSAAHIDSIGRTAGR
ncbi:MAG TPA: hypothetical protein VFL56_07370, partial [Solirubrobacterales bacterium]|nr:hypothetical protein [Solirubrobacterales bacterium]